MVLAALDATVAAAAAVAAGENVNVNCAATSAAAVAAAAENRNVNCAAAHVKDVNTTDQLVFPHIFISYDKSDVEKCKLLKDHVTAAGTVLKKCFKTCSCDVQINDAAL